MTQEHKAYKIYKFKCEFFCALHTPKGIDKFDNNANE